MTKREELIQTLVSEVGVKEEPAGSNKVKYNTWIYGKELYGPEYAWCGAFVSWGFNKIGLTIKGGGLAKGFVGCPYAVANVKKWGRLVTVPMPGDVVFFDWNGDGKFDHTGVFIKDLGAGLFESIEGNTAVGNDSNGGEVMIRQRKYKFAIFVRPNVFND